MDVFYRGEDKDNAYRLPLVVTTGCLAGVGLDLILQVFAQSREQLLSIPPFYVVGPPAVLEARKRRLGFSFPLREVTPAEALAVFPKALPVYPLSSPGPKEDQPGKTRPEHAALVLESITTATAQVMAGAAEALVTNPIQKASLYKAGFSFAGHTEFIADLVQQHTGQSYHPVMMMACTELRTVPLTIHVALRKAIDLLTETLVCKTARIVARDLERLFGFETPRLVLAGLNPHAGENGTMGTEEQEILEPAVARLQEEGIRITGPFPADTLFHEKALIGMEAVLACTHDQALIPIKTRAFDRAVNVTLGLPLVRTSPDHGTALDIAGTGQACTGSFLAALRLARSLGGRLKSQKERRFLGKTS